MSVTPDFIGQIYKDTTTGNLWRSNSTTPGDWTLELQNMQMKWSPTSVKLAEQLAIASYTDNGGVTSLEFLMADIAQYFEISGTTSLLTISFPNLVTMSNSPLNVDANSALTSISAPLLTSVSNELYLAGNTALVSLSFPVLVSCGASSTFCFSAQGSTLLQNVSLPVILFADSKNVDFSNCALSQASVDHILARAVANPAYVSGNIKVNGGTNSTPSAAGLLDVATLTGRGVVVNYNP